MLTWWIDEVKTRAYPEEQHTYPMPKEELEEFERILGVEMPWGKGKTVS